MYRPQRYHFALALKALVLPVSLAAWLGGSVAAQTSVRSEPRTAAALEAVNTRVYDVRDLLGSVADYPFTGTMAGSEARKPDSAATDAPKPQEASTGGAAATPANAPPSPRQDPNDQLIRLFMDAIDPKSWRDNGGSIGAIRIMYGRLIVTQTEENQKGVASILGQLRETNAVVVRVRAHWLLLQPGEVDSLYKKPAAGAGGETGRPQSAYPEIDRDALEKAGAKSGHFRAETVCLDSQTVHITSGRARRVLSSVIASVGTNAAAYEPVPETVRGGLVLQFTPVLTADRRAARLDVYSTFADVDTAATSAPPLPLSAEHAVGEGIVVDRYQAQSQELRTTVSIPVGRPILVGGMTLDPAAKGADSPELYLVVELTASEARG